MKDSDWHFRVMCRFLVRPVENVMMRENLSHRSM
jgi:hypothetical protein